MKAIHGIWVIILLSLILTLFISKAYAQPYYSVYPMSGTVNTDIFLQVRGLPGTGFYETYWLYLFWDNNLLNVYPDNSQTYNHYFDVHFSPPNSTIEALGNHTVYFEVWDPGRTTMFINATFVFTITQYFPGPEYIALNATYHQLLANYSALSSSYQNLMTQYDSLNTSYNSLLNQYNTLLGNYSHLLSSYGSLSSDYDKMSTTYNQLVANYQSLTSTCSNLNTAYQDLQTSYTGLTESYNSLQSIHNTLTSNYAQLQGNYTLLVTAFNDLQTKYNNSSNDLTNYRDLAYALIITTIVFLATTVYLARRKPKIQ
jgi:prefoldin subunit 5